jgi:hypothetical protein
MMKLFTLISILILSGSFANAEDFAVGIVLGDPTGLSAKVKMDGAHSVDGALAYSSGKHSGTHFHGDYLWDRARSWQTDKGPLNMYYGLGGRLNSYNDDDRRAQVSLGPRASIGLNFDIHNPNLELFGELAMILEVTPSIAADIDAGVGARIRF